MLIVEKVLKPTVPTNNKTNTKCAKSISPKRVAAGKDFSVDKARAPRSLKITITAEKFDNKPFVDPRL